MRSENTPSNTKILLTSFVCPNAEYSMLSTPLGTIAGASFLCALRQLNFEADSPKEDFDVAALCDVLDVEQVVP